MRQVIKEDSTKMYERKKKDYANVIQQKFSVES
jgi:hypothetical protein